MPDLSKLPWFLQDKEAKEIYRKSPCYVVLDVEAKGRVGPVDSGSDLVLACWAVVEYEATTTKYHWGDEFSQAQLLEDIANADFVVAHNAKYELQWLKRCGVELRDVLVYCTYLGQWVLDGNLREPRSLAALCKRYNVSAKWDLIKLLWETGLDTDDIPKSWLLEYCLQDVKSTHEIFLLQREEVYRRNQEHLVFQRCLTTAVLADVEFNGMSLDEQRVNEEYNRVVGRLAELEVELEQLSGGINLGSTKQLAVFLYETLAFEIPRDRKGKEKRTDGGARPTDANTISSLSAKTDAQRRFIELYREYNKLESLLSKSLSFFKGVCDYRGGTFRGVFNQGVTQTHRLSSSGVPILFPNEKKPKRAQFQNLPREYKKLFRSRGADYLLGEADGSQLEFRVAADLGQDKVAYKEICNKEDVHANTAKALTDAGEPTSRQEAKSRTFRPLYGGKSGTPAEVAYIEYFTNKYKGISKTQYNWSLTVANDKKLRTPYGMEFFWPDTTVDKRTGYISNTTSIYNYPIQGFATAEIIPIALTFFWHLTKDTRITTLNTVHDSILAEVHRDDVDLYKELSVFCFTTAVYSFLTDVYGYKFVVPLGCGIKLASHWGDTKNELSYDVYPDGTVNFKEKT